MYAIRSYYGPDDPVDRDPYVCGANDGLAGCTAGQCLRDGPVKAYPERIIDIDHGSPAAVRKHTGEKGFLAGKVVFHVPVIVEVFGGQVGEDADIDRITSYNVCYTKLLRCAAPSGPACGSSNRARRSARAPGRGSSSSPQPSTPAPRRIRTHRQPRPG